MIKACARCGKPFQVSDRPKAGRPRRWCSSAAADWHPRSDELQKPATPPSRSSRNRHVSTIRSAPSWTPPAPAAASCANCPIATPEEHWATRSGAVLPTNWLGSVGPASRPAGVADDYAGRNATENAPGVWQFVLNAWAR